MSLHSGLDTVSIISHGTYTETYGSAAPANIANLYASLGYLEDAPNVTIEPSIHYYRRLLPGDFQL